MKLILLAFVFASSNVSARDYCDISFTTEWSARREAPAFTKVMIRNKSILASKGYRYIPVGTTREGGFDLDIHVHDNIAGKISGTFMTPKGEFFRYTVDGASIDQAVKNIFRKLPECSDIE